MSIVLELSPQLENRLREQARAAGMGVDEYAANLLEEQLEPLPMTPAEAVEYWEREGLLGAFADGPDSPDLVRQWRDAEQSRMPKLG